MIETVLQFRFIVKSGRLIIADPSVFEDTENAVKLRNVSNGIWMVYCTYDADGFLNHFIARHEKSNILSARKRQRTVEIFSGQIGIFEASVYRKDHLAIGMPIEPYETFEKGDLWYCAMCHITNHSQQGSGTFGYGVVSDTQFKSHIVVAKKNWHGDYVEVEILRP
jgi:hypothetical protein